MRCNYFHDLHLFVADECLDWDQYTCFFVSLQDDFSPNKTYMGNTFVILALSKVLLVANTQNIQ